MSRIAIIPRIADAAWVTIAAFCLAAAWPTIAQTPAPQPMVKDGRYVMQGGAAVYGQLCAACHMADAKGASGAGAYPALAGDARLASPEYAADVIIHGRKGMPAFGDLLDDDQIAAVVTYVRSHHGNAYGGAVSPAAVKAMR
jgi:mono/diheme cytochrome c family protein